MNLTDVIVAEASEEDLRRYHEISIAFEVRSMLQPHRVDRGLGGLRFTEVSVDPPYLKDYDAHRGFEPLYIRFRREHLSHWAIFVAKQADELVGGAAVLTNAPGRHSMDRRHDIAILEDLRVQPAYRGEGIGAALFLEATAWARQQGCRQMTIETQNVNVPACRFYARQGCQLGGINLYGYAGAPQVAHEIMLIWYLEVAEIRS